MKHKTVDQAYSQVEADRKRKRAVKRKRNPLWLRSWLQTSGDYHLEVRDPAGTLRVLRSYRGEDHTLHIILGE